MAKGMKTSTIVLSILVIAVLAIGFSMLGGRTASLTGGLQDSGDEDVSSCNKEITPDLLIKGYDLNNKGTAITAEFIYRKEGNIAWSDGITGTEITGLEPEATYEFVMGTNTSNSVDLAYGDKLTHVAKCQEDETIEVGLYNDELEGSLTATFYNADDNAAAETFVAGQTQDVRVKFQAGTDEVYGNPFLSNPNVLILKVNSSEWDRPEKVYLEDGTELKSVEVPQRFDIESLGTSGFTEYAYEAPVISDIATNIYLKLNADDTNAPTVDGTAYLFAGDYFINEDGEISVGVETEEGEDVATSDPDSVTLDFAS